MSDAEMVSPEAAEILTVMLKEIRLPDDWDVSGFWLGFAQQLAQFMADNRDKIFVPDALMLATIGGMMTIMAKREVEASDAAAVFLRRHGGAGHA
ncbi:hypothetical protein GS397_00755 [Sphingobium yanoikuyae]|uniref:Uncharacterized protein n=1 Tax=Sphingobium yanoikuyae TaxID=13690 RepID=A0A6P1GBR1_SPHYA|nr:hypothetical protein [Sphingobium yanoikuyae]QHD65742.1 hypothetical protein GS397_00755 [Sphingobium yanoikuyae]